MRNIFLTTLETRDCGNGLRILTEPLKYVDPDGKLIIVPKGFTTDFASIPPLARFAAIVLMIAQSLALLISPWFYSLEAFAIFVILIAEWLENCSTDAIATVHDYIYKTRCRPRWKGDWILYTGMAARNAPKSGIIKSLFFLVNVRAFGWKPWRDDVKQSGCVRVSARTSVKAIEEP